MICYIQNRGLSTGLECEPLIIGRSITKTIDILLFAYKTTLEVSALFWISLPNDLADFLKLLMHRLNPHPSYYNISLVIARPINRCQHA